MINDMIEQALEALRGGGTLLYPTDTIWGIGCDATNAAAVERIYAIKERDHSKSMLILVSEAMLSAELPEGVRTLLLGDGRPTTVVVPAGYVDAALPDNLLAADGTVGVRVPRMGFCQALLSRFGRPVVSTSANFSGKPSPQGYADIEEALMRRVDFCLPDAPQFRHPATGASRILKVEADGTVAVIRG